MFLAASDVVQWRSLITSRTRIIKSDNACNSMAFSGSASTTSKILIAIEWSAFGSLVRCRLVIVLSLMTHIMNMHFHTINFSPSSVVRASIISL